MTDWVKHALTRRRVHRGRVMAEEPDSRLVYVVKFALGMTAGLVALEIAHLAVLRTWNSEVFAAITGLMGTVTGIFVGQKAQ
ncbi:MAG: hypothetical protein NWE99_10995 [Candidatus Bathyarchaeota archaeon]|nr:hypothetical protein [Candidatus Bathyarchaeota archaeon]